MTRVIRWTFRILTIASLLLALAAGGLWVRSHRMFESLNLRRWHWYSLASYDGGANFVLISKVSVLPGEDRLIPFSPTWQTYTFGQDWVPRMEYPKIPTSQLGFGHLPRQLWLRMDSGGIRREYYHEIWVVPYWSIIAAGLLLPGWRLKSWLHHRKQDRRTARGQCPVCGYDLRASPGRCPECGAVPALSPANGAVALKP